jgi:F0F1-type ATP synthase membrane subunit c/vacuolar-type H+-ATPase subunit K
MMALPLVSAVYAVLRRSSLGSDIVGKVILIAVLAVVAGVYGMAPALADSDSERGTA